MMKAIFPFRFFMLLLSLGILGCETTPKEQVEIINQSSSPENLTTEKKEESTTSIDQTLQANPSIKIEEKLKPKIIAETLHPETPVSSSSTTASSVSSGEISTSNLKPNASHTILINGIIIIVNQNENFAVVDFQDGVVPPPESELGVYRNDQFVGSIRITPPIKNSFASADILKGTLQRGDIVH